METCCGMIFFIVIGAAVLWLLVAAADERSARIKNIESYMSNIDKERENIKKCQESIEANLRSFFANNIPIYRSYDELNRQIEGVICGMNQSIDRIKEVNGKLVSIASDLDRNEMIIQEEVLCKRETHVVDDLKVFGEKVYKLSSSKMMDKEFYGKIDKRYWDCISGMQRKEVVEYVNRCDSVLKSGKTSGLNIIDIEEVLKCVWFLATEKTFSASDFQNAETLFRRIYRRGHVDITIANFYAKKKMGGEEVLREEIRNLLKSHHSSEYLILIASSLMWMSAFTCENMVLKHMLAEGYEMTAKAQERLHSLSNGGGKAPSSFEVKSSNQLIYFDVSSLAWREDEYLGFFENLAFQDKELLYSLAVRDENKDMIVPQGINVPSPQTFVSKFEAVFAEEYGASVTIREVDCVALSGSGEEKLAGILGCSSECKQMGILMHIARIGRRLNIKFYTLFVPTGTEVLTQKQQVLSMYNKLSPSTTMWESSLKDTMLMAVEQLLNDDTAGTCESTISDILDENPVF